MNKILIFAGTTEGRKLAEALSASSIECMVSVATEYGKEVMPQLKGVTSVAGRLTTEQMQKLIKENQIDVVVDATHPFATVVSENIKSACQSVDCRYIRLKRDTSASTDGDSQRLCIFKNSKECAKALEETEGNILLTTGSKELELFCVNEEVRDRIIARVLPGEESLSLCTKAGLPGKQIIAMQGPFGQKLNEALIEQYAIKTLVTKESGRAGGLDEKLNAAISCGIDVFLIGSPDVSEGISMAEVLSELGVAVDLDAQVEIRLIGIGMGSEGTLTVGAKDYINSADYIIGAERMIAPYTAKKEKKPFYLAKDILPYIEGKSGKIAILFSGDSGFYSGTRSLYEALKNAGYKDVRVLPGISSISYISSLAQIPWSEAEIYSVHGKGRPADWEGGLRSRIKKNRHTFLLLSGIEDVNYIGKMLMADQASDYRIVLGRNLSYEDESIEWLSPSECVARTDKGLYTCIVVNNNPIARTVTNSHKDDEFIRAKVPMTKEEIRTVSISKLGLKENSLVWDIGSGTGSIAVEIAGYSPDIRVYAIEHKEDAVELIGQNADKFGTANVTVIKGKAPEALAELPAPTHVFIGGSSGELENILELIYSKNSSARVVLNAVSLETIAQVTALVPRLKIKDFETVSMSVSRSRAVGNYNLLQAENPVMIFSFTFEE